GTLAPPLPKAFPLLCLPLSCWLLSVAFLLLGLRAWFTNARTRLRLPPGPPGNFLSGNFRDFKSPQRWKIFARWRELYGDKVHVRVLQRSAVIINDLHAALEILRKQSAATAGRPRFVMACGLMGFDTATATSQPNELHRRMRRYMVLALHARTERHSIIADERDTLLNKLGCTPRDFSAYSTGCGLCCLALRLLPHSSRSPDPLVELTNRSLEPMSIALSSTYLVEFFPILRYIPE
ncbi:LOW QUALITY PROTEIN: hypothetical protein RSAG8_12727, partial [Rhizoctonia solani AG-8 WAC10335]